MSKDSLRANIADPIIVFVPLFIVPVFVKLESYFSRLYPDIDENLLKKFYGVSGMSMTKELWNKLVISKIVSKVGQSWKGTDKINLTDFYANTRPKFVMSHCMLEHIDCRHLWNVRSKLIALVKTYLLKNCMSNGREFSI